MSNSVWPHRWQPTRLHRPWDSPGKNTGVGCHFLLQCRKVKSESEVAQSCPTLCDPMDCSLPGSSVHGILQARTLEWVSISFSNACMHTKLLQSCPTLLDPMDCSLRQAPSSMGFSRREYWSGMPLPSPVPCSVKSSANSGMNELLSAYWRKSSLSDQVVAPDSSWFSNFIAAVNFTRTYAWNWLIKINSLFNHKHIKRSITKPYLHKLPWLKSRTDYELHHFLGPWHICIAAIMLRTKILWCSKSVYCILSEIKQKLPLVKFIVTAFMLFEQWEEPIGSYTQL